jgi:hypothetical protein
MNCLTLKCPSCSEALHYNKVNSRFECTPCKISLDPLQDAFTPLTYLSQRSAFSVEAEALTSKLNKIKGGKHDF